MPPYDGAQPQEAKAWVTQNLPKALQGKEVSRTFGLAKYTLRGFPRRVALAIEGKGYDRWSETLE